MPMPSRPTPRALRRQQALKARGGLHPHPEQVTDPLFHTSAFFDPHDGVQVKYEMLRRVRLERRSVSETAQAFGFSRPAFYQAQRAFSSDGLPGLLPRKRGPKRPHKLTDEILAALAAMTTADGTVLRAGDLAARLAQDFGITAHPRSIERSLTRYRERQEKKR
jgi:transposase